MIYHGILPVSGELLRDWLGIHEGPGEVMIEAVPLDGDRVGIKILSSKQVIPALGGSIFLQMVTHGSVVPQVCVEANDQEEG